MLEEDGEGAAQGNKVEITVRSTDPDDPAILCHFAGQEVIDCCVIGGGRADGDTLIGNNSGNNLTGGSGDDTIRGEGGDDTLFGNAKIVTTAP